MLRTMASGLATLASLACAAASWAQGSYPMTAVDTAHGDREALLLWPEGAPGALGSEAVDKPNITLYRADPARASGAAVVVCPGGGYGVLAADHEGKQVAGWLNSLGVSAFVLQYRLGPRYHHPAPLQDAQRAIRMVRARAAEWHVDTSRIGVLGSSAGGHLASTAATHYEAGDPTSKDAVERMSSKPSFAVLLYPVITMDSRFTHAGSRRMLLGESPDSAAVRRMSNELQVTQDTPPTFLVATTDDATVPVENSLTYYHALHEAGVPVEMHLFETGKHGFGLAEADPVLSVWPKLCEAWLRGRGLLRAAAGGSAAVL